MKFLTVVILSILSFTTSHAAVEYKKFNSVQQEEIYKLLIKELRCLVCQNQTIADSNAALAQDLRRQVYEMLQQGKTKQQIADFMTDRYGDFVLYNPPFKAKTSLLWLGPIAFLVIGLVILFFFSRTKRSAKNIKLSDDELQQRAKIKSLLTHESEQ